MCAIDFYRSYFDGTPVIFRRFRVACKSGSSKRNSRHLRRRRIRPSQARQLSLRPRHSVGGAAPWDLKKWLLQFAKAVNRIWHLEKFKEAVPPVLASSALCAIGSRVRLVVPYSEALHANDNHRDCGFRRRSARVGRAAWLPATFVKLLIERRRRHARHLPAAFECESNSRRGSPYQSARPESSATI